MSKGITFFKEDRQPTPDNPNEIISAIVDDEVADYINRLEKHKNNWEDLKRWLEDEIVTNKTNQIEDPNYPEWYIKWNSYLNLLNKMEELEEDK